MIKSNIFLAAFLCLTISACSTGRTTEICSTNIDNESLKAVSGTSDSAPRSYYPDHSKHITLQTPSVFPNNSHIEQSRQRKLKGLPNNPGESPRPPSYSYQKDFKSGWY